MKLFRIVWLVAISTALSMPIQAQPEPSLVSVAKVIQTNIVPTIPVSGTVYSRNDVQITTGVDGQLVLVAEPGTELEKGDVVAKIDDTQLTLQKNEQYQLAERARSQLRFLNNQLKRQRDLLSSNSTSANQMEQTESDRNVAASDLSIAEVRIKQIDDQLRRATIRAPFTGVVIERLRHAGEDVSRGTILGRMMDTENLEVRVFVPLKYANRVSRGHELTLFGFESQHTGTIRSIVPSADMRSQTIEVRIDLPKSVEETWTAGQLVSVAVPMRNAQATLAIPRDALILRQDGTYVFKVGSDNTVQRIAVKIGDSQGDLVSVEGKLSQGDRVAIRGAEGLQEGQSVRIINGGSGLSKVSAPTS